MSVILANRALSEETLRSLTQKGYKVECPLCGKRSMSENYRPLHESGIGQHIRATHPEYGETVVDIGRNWAGMEKRRLKEKAQAEEREARERPLREHVVTGAFLDEVLTELNSLIDMMEPYYSQCNGAKTAYALVEHIERMQNGTVGQVEAEIEWDDEEEHEDEED